MTILKPLTWFGLIVMAIIYGDAGWADPSSTSLCDLSSARGTAMYNKYCGSTNSGSANTAPAAGPTASQQLQMQGAQQLGTAIGNQVGKALFGSPDDDAQKQAQKQLEFAAQQLNNSGLYLFKQGNYAGAINEFQQALDKTPNDRNILNNLALAKQKLKDIGVASQNASALGQVLPDVSSDNGAVRFDQLTHSTLPSPNSSVLNLVNLNSDASVVDLTHATKFTVDPASLKAGSHEIPKDKASAPTQPASNLQLPESKDMELLWQPADPAPAKQVSQQTRASLPKPVNTTKMDAQIKAETGRQIDAIFAQPGGLDDILEKQAIDLNPK